MMTDCGLPQTAQRQWYGFNQILSIWCLSETTQNPHSGSLTLNKRSVGRGDLRWSLHAFFGDTGLIQHCAIQKHHRKPEGLVLGCFFCVLGGWGGWGGWVDIKNIVPGVGGVFLWRAWSGFLGFSDGAGWGCHWWQRLGSLG